MSEEMEWGPEIDVTEGRPSWLKDTDPMQWRGTKNSKWYGEGSPAGLYFQAGDSFEAIRVLKNHPYYLGKTKADDDLKERCVALVRKLATYTDRHHHTSEIFIAADEARAIMEAMEPVDADLLLARKIVADYHEDLGQMHTAKAFRDGMIDNSPLIKSHAAAIKRGRALERGE